MLPVKTGHCDLHKFDQRNQAIGLDLDKYLPDVEFFHWNETKQNYVEQEVQVGNPIEINFLMAFFKRRSLL